MGDRDAAPDTGTDEQPLRGVQMDGQEVDDFIREQGVGVLSLADADDASGVPMSFGYDGERLYFFLLRFGDESTKLDFADATGTASFATYAFEGPHTWRSVVVRGPIERVPEERRDEAEDALFDTAEFANLFPHGEPTTERPRHQLVPESLDLVGVRRRIVEPHWVGFVHRPLHRPEVVIGPGLQLIGPVFDFEIQVTAHG